jgi:hypothetical protein
MTLHVPRASTFDWRAPTMPLAGAALVAPFAAVLQSKAMSPIGLVALIGCILLARLRRGAWPWPRGAATRAALGLAAWSMASALWSIDWGRSLSDGAALVGMVLLAAAAAESVRHDTSEERRRLGIALVLGLVLGLGTALLDHISGNALRAAVRGLHEAPANLAFGLKPAASVMALLLPLVAGVDWPARWRAVALFSGLAILVLIPGDTAKLAALAGLVTTALVALRGGIVVRGLAVTLAALVLVTPLLLGPAIGLLGQRVESLPPSGIHRLLIWDFSLARAAEKPLAGWGMEAARRLPGGDGRPDPTRLGITRPDLLAWFTQPQLRLLPLHPHNGPLQLRLELGWVGGALAAVAVLLLGLSAVRCAVPAAAAGALASGFVTFFASFGIWQNWWLCAAAMALAIAAGLPGRRVP